MLYEGKAYCCVELGGFIASLSYASSKLMFEAGASGQQADKAQTGCRTSKKLDSVKHQRRGMTAVTTSRSDVTAGPIVFCAPEGRISAA